jgi:hypothetical protein
MPGEADNSFDFFLSRRGSVAAVAREVENVLTENGYRVFVQDYDIPLGVSFIEVMHEAIKNSRDLVILFTSDYEASPYTRKEFTSFEAERHHGGQDRQIVVLRCEDVPLRGLLADNVYQDLVGITDPDERRRRVIAAAERRSAVQRPQHGAGSLSAFRRALQGSQVVPMRSTCQTASKFDPRSASNFDPLWRRALAVALAPSELVGVAETARARVGV